MVARLYAGYRNPAPLQQQIEQIDTIQLPQAIEEYRRSGRNPLADIVLAELKPKRNIDQETRLRQNAKLQALNNMLSLIGKGIAATGGLRPTPIDNRSIYNIQSRLQQLDDIYAQEGMRYDQNRLLSALRKDQANLQAAQAAIDSLSAQRTATVGLYKEAQQHNRQLAEKAADIEFNASKYRTDMAYKYEDLKEKKRSNRAREALQGTRLNRENPRTLLRNTVNGGYIELTPEVRADLAGVVSRIMEQRESARKGPDGEWIAGKYPLPMNNELTDEELRELNDALKDNKVTIKQEAILTRLFNAAQGGGFYDPKEKQPLGVPPKPTSGYAAANHDQYKYYLSGQLRHMLDSEQLENNTITVEHARGLFDGLRYAPASAVRKVLEEAGFKVID